MVSDQPPDWARISMAFAIIGTILAGFLYRIAVHDPVEPWLVLLVSVLGLAAAASVMGPEAVHTAFVALRHVRR